MSDIRDEFAAPMIEYVCTSHTPDTVLPWASQWDADAGIWRTGGVWEWRGPKGADGEFLHTSPPRHLRHDYQPSPHERNRRSEWQGSTLVLRCAGCGGEVRADLARLQRALNLIAGDERLRESKPARPGVARVTFKMLRAILKSKSVG